MRPAPRDFVIREHMVPWMLITPARVHIPCKVVISLNPISHLGWVAMVSSFSRSTRWMVP